MDNLKMETDKAKESTSGLTRATTMGIGRLIKWTVKVNTAVLQKENKTRETLSGEFLKMTIW